jgi:hypothetical protein
VGKKDGEAFVLVVLNHTVSALYISLHLLLGQVVYSHIDQADTVM